MRIAFIAVLLAAAPAAAVTTTLDLTGTVANTTTGTFTSGGKHYSTGRLLLDGLTPFTISDGDTIDVNLTLDHAFTVPAGNDYQFLGVNFEGDGNPAGGSNSGSITFTNPTGVAATVGTNCGNCLSNLYGQRGAGAFSFTGLAGTESVLTLTTPFNVTDVTLTYQVDSIAGVPEPMSWALLATGFAAVGHATRRRVKMARVLA